MRWRPLITLVISLLLPAAICAEPAKPRDFTRIVSHIKREAVESTAIASIGYSKRLRALEIEFRNGAIYRYLEVAPSIYLDLMKAKSKARFYDDNIRKKYRSLHVRPRAE
ncbi:MAG: hypothetical protein QOD12_1953 [Verrucomicrobiota bacterium]|jgi:lysyl-tRNA synthetase class 2